MKREKQADIISWWHSLALRADARALAALVSLGGALAWVLPWPVFALFLPPAVLSALTAYKLLPGGRAALKACLGFVLFWTFSYFLLQIWEQGQGLPALCGSIVFGGRLCAVFGLTLLLPLCLGAVTAGRVLAWYLQRLALLLRGRPRESALQAAWQAGLGLALMAAFMPRISSALKGLAQNLKLRAPHLSAYGRLRLLGLAALRLFGSQTWDIALSIAVRGLYRAEPWEWRTPARF